MNQIMKIEADFSGYFKYRFIYKARYKDKQLALWFGGSVDDIYRQEFKAHESFEIDEKLIEFDEKDDNYTYDGTEEY